MAKYKENPLRGKDYYLYEIPELTKTVAAGFSLNAFDFNVTDTYVKPSNPIDVGWNGVLKLDEVAGNYYVSEQNELGDTNRFLASVSGTTYRQSAFTIISLNGNLFPQGNVPLEFTKTLIKTKTIKYDLTKLNLPEGTHNISVIAKADGYKSSAASKAVQFVVAPPKLNPATIELDGDTLNIYDESGNATSAIIFVDGVAKELVEIGKVSLMSFNIDTITYQAEEGMTWYEWANSDYDTDGWSCSDNNSYILDVSGVKAILYNGLEVGRNIIVANRVYSYTHLGGGGSN